MTARSYLSALEQDDLTGQWVLNQLQQRVPALAAEVIDQFLAIENHDHFEEFGFPRR
jgi:hypothetical protein